MPARRARRVRRLLLPALALAAAWGAGGCARAARALARPYVLAPSGLEAAEQAMRDDLAAGRWDAAGRRAASERAGGPGDALLRALYAGTAGFYAGRYAESARAFDQAGRLADERFTQRVSRNAAALLTSDRALPYVPGDNERLMAGYYATLAYLHAGDLDGAAVEARRLALALQRADDRRDPDDRSLRAALRYLTGAVFEAAGEREDADVAYRNAALLGARVDAAAGTRAAADSALRGTRRGPRARRAAERARAAAPGRGTGEVVVAVEGGWVAHRVDERLRVRLDGDASVALARSSDGVPGPLADRLAALLQGDAGLWAGELPDGLALADSAPAVAAPAVAAPAVAAPAPAAGPAAASAARPVPPFPGAPRRPGGALGALGAIAARAAANDGGPEGRAAGARERDGAWRPGSVFTLAWPAYRRARWAPPAVGVVAAGAADGGAGGGAGGPAPRPAPPDAAAVVRGDLTAAAAGDFRRGRGALLARLVTRAAVRAALAREAGRRHRELGGVVRALGDAVEHADTRSWHLLPGAVQVVRLRLPAGEQALAADVAGRRVPLGTVRVAPGAIRFVSVRLWDAGGERVTAAGVEPPAAGAPAAAPAALAP